MRQLTTQEKLEILDNVQKGVEAEYKEGGRPFLCLYLHKEVEYRLGKKMEAPEFTEKARSLFPEFFTPRTYEGKRDDPERGWWDSEDIVSRRKHIEEVRDILKKRGGHVRGE